jgi:hypothetical protein
MNLDVGPYRLRLPAVATFPASSERPRPHRAVPQVRLGPFDLHVSVLDGTLKEWREHAEWTTKHTVHPSEIVVNGIPGLRLPIVPDSQRLDYAFQSPGLQLVDIVAWSDRAVDSQERALIEDLIQTLQIRPSAASVGAGPPNNRWRGP